MLQLKIRPRIQAVKETAKSAFSSVLKDCEFECECEACCEVETGVDRGYSALPDPIEEEYYRAVNLGQTPERYWLDSMLDHLEIDATGDDLYDWDAIRWHYEDDQYVMGLIAARRPEFHLKFQCV
ncbi:hypothetical protein IQ250_24360 [Pseudanabaenaceae cyanobacterium LEGE 13415]|nr:hypothetical protein [Pseudanabaenaceae cyanobacterium LEGE 13415]